MEILIIVLITLLNGALAMAEAAIIAVRKARLQQLADNGDQRAKATLAVACDPNRFLSTTQIGITLVGILAGAFGGVTIAENLAAQIATIPALEPYSEPISVVVVVLLTTYLSLVIGELVPKRVALQNPERVAMFSAPWIRVLENITAPIVKLLGLSTNLVLRLLGVKSSDEPPVTAEEIQVLIRQGVEAGVFEVSEQEMVAGVFSLDDRRVDTLMTPRTEIKWLDLDDPVEDNLRKISHSPHSRFPVARGSLDNVQGIVRAKDLLDLHLNGQQLGLQPCVRETLFIPESATASRALALFKHSGKHIALVVSEHGGIEGLITLNNLIEKIIGETEPPQVTQRADGSWLLDGLLPVDELKDIIDVRVLPGEDEGYFQTLGGFIMTHLGRIPNTADHFEWNGLYFEVVDMDGKRVDKVLVQRRQPEAPASE